MTQTVLEFTKTQASIAVKTPARGTDHLSERTQSVAPHHAPLCQFRSSVPRILYGAELKAVKDIAQSIRQEGLIFPLLVSEQNGRLFVIDGRKRLAALRRLSFLGQLPRSLKTVPFIMSAHSGKIPVSAVIPRRELYERITRKVEAGQTVTAIANALHITTATVQDILNITRLSPSLRTAYWRGDLSLAQVKAFSTLSNFDAQDRLLSLLGPFASVDIILEAIASGQTVIGLDGDNLDDSTIVIMPSKTRPREMLRRDREAKPQKAA